MSTRLERLLLEKKRKRRRYSTIILVIIFISITTYGIYIVNEGIIQMGLWEYYFTIKGKTINIFGKKITF